MKTFFALVLAVLAGTSQAADNSRFFPLTIEDVGGKALASYAADRAWASLPQGAVEFDGVPFNVVNKVQVQGNGDAQANRLYPTRILGIRVGQRPARLHLLHGGALGDGDGRFVVSLHFRYAGGTAYTNHLAYGVHFRDWWKHVGEPLGTITDPGSKQVWAGSSTETPRRGSTHRLFKTTIELPPTQKLLETIDLFSLFSRGGYVVVGMTAETAAPGAPAAKPLPSADDAKYRDELLLRVTDSNMNPLPGTRIRGTALVQNELIPLGTIEDGEFEPGMLMVDFPAGTRELRLTVTSSRFASTEFTIRSGEEGRLPREASVALKSGVRIGGIVRAQNGRPVPRAKVEVSVLKRDAAGQLTPFRYAEVTADPQGKWKTDAVPDNFTDLSFKVTHADFRTKDFKSSINGANGTVSRAALLDGAAEFTLKSGVAITGTVRDDKGEPAPDVMLALTHGAAPRKTTRAVTDAQGGFRFALVDEGAASLLAEAGGFAPTLRRVDVIEDAPPIQLALSRGRTLKGRVFELKPPQFTSRSPASGVSVSIVSPENSLIRWSGRTDDSGHFEWQNAPITNLMIAARRVGSNPESFNVPSTTNDVEIVLGGALLGWGTVVDAETRKPIPEFTVTPGESWNPDQINWRPQDAVQARDGAFTLTHRDRGRVSDRTVIKVEAPGYWPQSAFLRDAGTSSNAFELRRGTNPKGVARLPNGQAAARAEVAIVGEGYLPLGKGQFSARRGGGRQPGLTRSDAEGRFELPLSLSQRVVIVHPDGYGETTLSNLADRTEVTLQPWGTVEGVVMVGNKPKADADVKLNENMGSDGVQYDYEAFNVKADSEGRFRFTHVPPGPRWLVRLIPTNNKSRAWSHQTPVNVVAGKVAQVTVGGTGRPVIGKVVASDPSREIEWNSGHHSFGTVQPQPPRLSSPEDSRTWNASPEAKAAREAYRYYAVVFAKDGSFRIDDVPTGNYELRLFFNEPDPARPGTQGKPLGNIRHPVEIASIPNGRSDEPLDVGTLELKLRE